MSETEVKKPGAIIADGNEHMASLTSSMAKACGYFIACEANNARDTLAALGRRGFGLMIIDDALPGMDAVELVRQIRADAENVNRTMPIIMTSAAPDRQRLQLARDAGVTEFLRKPFSAADLKSRIDMLEAKPRAFIESSAYTGPDRRRRTVETPNDQRRSEG